MLLIITYSRIVFWLILSVTCKQNLFLQVSKHHIIIGVHAVHMFYLTVTRHSSSLRHRLLRLSEPSPQSKLSSLSIRSCMKHKHKCWCDFTLTHIITGMDYTFHAFLPLTRFPTYLHPLFSLVKPHEHVDDVKAWRWFVLLVNPSEKCTESLEREVRVTNIKQTMRC